MNIKQNYLLLSAQIIKLFVMNKYQTAKQDSYKLIVKEARNNPSALSLILKFSNGIDRLEEITVKIDQIRVQQEKDLTGITSDKLFTMGNLTDYLIDVAGAVHSYALGKNDNTLMAKVSYTSSVVEKLTQSQIIAAAGIVFEEAGKLAPADLANEGISADELEEFGALNNYFKTIKSASREAIIDRSGSTEKLSELFSEARQLIKGSLDRLATQYKRKDPDFYLKYRAARNLLYSRPQKEKSADNGATNKLV